MTSRKARVFSVITLAAVCIAGTGCDKISAAASKVKEKFAKKPAATQAQATPPKQAEPAAAPAQAAQAAQPGQAQAPKKSTAPVYSKQIDKIAESQQASQKGASIFDEIKRRAGLADDKPADTKAAAPAVPPIRPANPNEEWLPPGMGRGNPPPDAPKPDADKAGKK